MTTPRAALAAALDGHLPRMAFLSYGKEYTNDPDWDIEAYYERVADAILAALASQGYAVARSEAPVSGSCTLRAINADGDCTDMECIFHRPWLAPPLADVDAVLKVLTNEGWVADPDATDYNLRVAASVAYAVTRSEADATPRFRSADEYEWAAGLNPVAGIHGRSHLTPEAVAGFRARILRQRAVTRSEAGLDVERLRRAVLDEATSERWGDLHSIRWASETFAALVAQRYDGTMPAEYARLAADPEPSDV